MWDARLSALAAGQFNRVSREQLVAVGLSEGAIDRRLRSGQLVRVAPRVYAIGPALDHDPWARRMTATLVAPGSFLSHASAAVAWKLWSYPVSREVVTRPGSGGTRLVGGVVVHRSLTLAGETTSLRGVPVTSVPRTLVDLAGEASDRGLAYAIREALRLERSTIPALLTYVGKHRGRRGVARLRAGLRRYSGLPVDRARSGAEVRALEVIRDAGIAMPALNKRIAGEEADLSWSDHRVIVEIDGEPFHRDRGEDARKQAIWEAAGWRVRRVDASDVYERPRLLLDSVPRPARAERPNTP